MQPAPQRAPTPFRPERFTPASGLANAHVQTVCGRYLRRPMLPTFERERLEMEDGDFLDLDHPRLGVPDDAPLVLLLHGLEGSARRGYAINTYRELARRGLAAVGLNFRSCSGPLNRTARFYHSGETGDLRRVLGHLAERFPGRTMGAVGFSLGGNALLKFLGEAPLEAVGLLRGAAAISVPYDLAAGARHLEESLPGRLYARHFVRSLVGKVEAKAALLDGQCDLERVRRSRSFREFDDAATAPLHGFVDADDYYARSSAQRFLAQIRLPTLLVHARDDPFLPGRFLPLDMIEDNSWLTPVITERGGHVGFLAGRPWALRFWAEAVAADFLALVLGTGAGSPSR